MEILARIVSQIQYLHLQNQMEIGIKVDLETHKEHKHINMIKLKANKTLYRAC